MNAKILFFLLLISYPRIYAQTNHLPNRSSSAQGFLDTIPFEFVKNKIIIPVLLHGKHRRFILDTGAPLLITKELQQECKFGVLSKEVIADISQRLDSNSTLHIPLLQIGNIDFKDATAIIADLNASLLACFQIDGIIGSNLLKNSILHIDYQQKIIILTDQIEQLKLSPQYASNLFLEARQHTPIIEIKPFPQAKEQVFIDTGDDGFYSMSIRSFQFFMEKTNLQKYVTSSATGASTAGLHGLERDTTKHVMRLDSLKINEIYFSNLSANTHPNPNSRIGAAILKYGTLTIDYLNKKFYFVPFLPTSPIIFEPSQDAKLGFAIKNEGNVLKVGAVWQGSEAWQKGIQVNDTITQINDNELINKNICELIFLLDKIFENSSAFVFHFFDTQGNPKIVTLNKF